MTHNLFLSSAFLPRSSHSGGNKTENQQQPEVDAHVRIVDEFSSENEGDGVFEVGEGTGATASGKICARHAALRARSAVRYSVRGEASLGNQNCTEAVCAVETVLEAGPHRGG